MACMHGCVRGGLDREDLRAGEELSDDDDDDDGDEDDDKADAVVPDTPSAQQDQTGAVPLVRIQNGTHPPAPTAAHRRSTRIRLARTAAAPPARTTCARTHARGGCGRVVCRSGQSPSAAAVATARVPLCSAPANANANADVDAVRCGAVQVLRRKRIGGIAASSGALWRGGMR